MRSDDYVINLKNVDVTAGFAATTLSAAELYEIFVELETIAWGGAVAADRVAYDLEDSQPAVAALLRNDTGFEVYIDRTSALAWLRATHPQIYAQFMRRYAEAGVVGQDTSNADADTDSPTVRETHALQGTPETVIAVPGGYVACPAFPLPCSYVRLVAIDENGIEVEEAYWDSAEWQQPGDPTNAMGAIMGALRGGVMSEEDVDAADDADGDDGLTATMLEDERRNGLAGPLASAALRARCDADGNFCVRVPVDLTCLIDWGVEQLDDYLETAINGTSAYGLEDFGWTLAPQNKDQWTALLDITGNASRVLEQLDEDQED